MNDQHSTVDMLSSLAAQLEDVARRKPGGGAYCARSGLNILQQAIAAGGLRGIQWAPVCQRAGAVTPDVLGSGFTVVAVWNDITEIAPVSAPSDAKFIDRALRLAELLRAEARPMARPGRRWSRAKVQAAAKARLKNNRWPGLNALATLIGCPPATLSGAIAACPELRRIRDAAMAAAGRESKVFPVAGLATDTMESTGSLEPFEAVAVGEAWWSRLLSAAEPRVRAKLNGMSTSEQRSIWLQFAELPEEKRDEYLEAVLESLKDSESARTPTVHERSQR